MEKINLCEGVVAQMMESEAWSNVSSKVPFSESQLEKFGLKLDWEMVSSNSNIFWTESMLEKFKNKVKWDRLASSINEDCLSIELLERFKDRWDWDEFSDSGTVKLGMVQAFPDKFNYRKLITNYRFTRNEDCEAFLREFEDRIPATEFKNSHIWDELVEKKEKNILKEVSRA